MFVLYLFDGKGVPTLTLINKRNSDITAPLEAQIKYVKSQKHINL